MDYIPPMPQTSRIIGDSGLHSHPHGFRLDLRLPWYRSLPLSTVEIGEVSFDGQRIDPSKIQFELEGKSFALSAMPDLVDRVWYVLDSAFLRVDAAAVKPGTDHDVSVTLTLYPPYIRGLKRVSRETKTLRAQ
jgi:hypothetical protein